MPAGCTLAPVGPAYHGGVEAAHPGVQHVDSNRPRLLLAIVLTVAVLVVEIGGGFLAHSLALWSDAGHVASDLLALGLTWFAQGQSRRPADKSRTYGYERASIVAALANAVVLAVVVVVIIAEAVQRFAHPAHIAGGIVIGAAALAVGLNAVIALSLHALERNGNVRILLLHVLGDLGAGLGVIAAGVIILTTGWTSADPVIAILIALLIAWGTLRITTETVNVLLEGSPRGLDVALVEQLLESGPGVCSVHDLHVWTIGRDQAALSAHLVVEVDTVTDGEDLVRALEGLLSSRFQITHTTIQVERGRPCDPDRGHWPVLGGNTSGS